MNVKATEFCYWLQGAFELSHLEALTLMDCECITKHLALVAASAKTDDSLQKVKNFCGWLGGAIDLIAAGDGLAVSGAATVKKKLAELFEHVIDKSYANSDQLNDIHNPHRPGMRC